MMRNIINALSLLLIPTLIGPVRCVSYDYFATKAPTQSIYATHQINLGNSVIDYAINMSEHLSQLEIIQKTYSGEEEISSTIFRANIHNKQISSNPNYIIHSWDCSKDSQTLDLGSITQCTLEYGLESLDANLTGETQSNLTIPVIPLTLEQRYQSHLDELYAEENAITTWVQQ